MSLVAVGINYKTVSVQMLEQASVSKEALLDELSWITDQEGIKGAVLLSTCNRVEIYVDAHTDPLGIRACKSFFLKRLKSTDSISIDRGFYVERGEDVPRHLFRVVCSLDSQILGEAQILGQIKQAYMFSLEQKLLTDVLTELFKTALRVGKQTRTNTDIGKDSVSMSTAAFKAASQHFEDLSSCRVLFVGAGKMSALILPYLIEAGVKDFTVTSRTIEHAQEFAQSCRGRAVEFEKRYEAIVCSDIVFSATSSLDPVITFPELKRHLEEAGAEKAQEIIFVDQAIPRDVDENCDSLPGVILYNILSLQDVVTTGVSQRIAAVGAVERMVAEAEESFLAWLQKRNVEPTIKEMYKKGMRTVDDELRHLIRSLESQYGRSVSDDEKKVLEKYGKAIVNKILHGPTIRLKMEAQNADSYYYTGAARYLFGLDTYPPGCTPHACREKNCLHGQSCPKGLS